MSQGSQASPRQQGGDSYSNMYLNKGQTSSSLVPLHNPVPKKNVAAKVPHLNTTALPIDLAFQELHSVSGESVGRERSSGPTLRRAR